MQPVLMTTLATMFGHLPLLLAEGPGAGARNLIGFVLVGSMVIRISITLFAVPALYSLRASRKTSET